MFAGLICDIYLLAPFIYVRTKELTMDIQYLLLLQQLRNSAGGWLTSLMMLVSHMATVGCLVVCVVIYWGINRRLGYWLVSNCISSLPTGLVASCRCLSSLYSIINFLFLKFTNINSSTMMVQI